MRELELFAQLADLKEIDYRNTLAISALIELLVEKGIITRNEFTRKAIALDQNASFEAENLARS